LAWANGWLAAYLAACARLVGGLPGAQATSAGAVVLLAGATLLVLVLVHLRPPRGRRAAAVLAMALALVLAWRSAPDDALPPPKGFRLTVLDVGQGDAILLQVPEGAVLVDQGPPEADVVGLLERLGVRRLAALVTTHPHRDHVGGGQEVLAELPVGQVLDPLQPTDSVDERKLLKEARRRRVPVVAARIGRAYRLGRLRIRVLWPDDAGSTAEDPHAHGVVLLASYGSIDALLTGDSEGDVTVPLRPPPVEILKVAHHGSVDDQLDELLALTRPRIALISLGADNDYGHPAPSTLATLGRVRGLAVYRTDTDGRIVVEADGERVSIETEG
jgi:competence protein ComEC